MTGGPARLERRGKQVIKQTMTVGAVVAMLGLAGCGYSPQDRALSGAALGAGTGAVAGAVFNGLAPGTGALIGGLVGGAAGVMTNPNQVNMGRPAWR